MIHLTTTITETQMLWHNPPTGTTRVVGPGFFEEGREQRMWDAMFPRDNPSQPTPDPYPPDVLAACPMAREWGVRLVHKVEDSVAPWCWESDCGHWWMQSGSRWEKGVGRLGTWETRDRALAAAPTVPPPGFVPKAEVVITGIPSGTAVYGSFQPKAEGKAPTLLEKCAEAGYNANEYLCDGDYWDTRPQSIKKVYREMALTVLETALAGDIHPQELKAAIDAYTDRENFGIEMVRALVASRLALLRRLRKEVTSKGGSDGK